MSSKMRSIWVRREAQDRAVQVDVLPTGEIGVEAGTQLEQGGEATPGHDAAGGGAQGAGHALEQGGLARAVVAEEGEGLPLGDLERHVVERLEHLVGVAADPLMSPLLG
jgi:hypothetical protein